MLRIITIKFNHFFNKTIKSIDKNEKGSENPNLHHYYDNLSLSFFSIASLILSK